MKLERLAITCGGTGGHFYPGLSVARKLRDEGGEALLLLSGVNAPHQKDIAESFGVSAVALPRMPSPRGIGSGVAFGSGALGGVCASLRELKRFRPQALLGMGSFTSLPPILAAHLLRIPVFLHDGNARIGKANRFFSSRAKLLATAFPACNADKCRCEVLVTGMPLRPELEAAAGISREAAEAELERIFGVKLEAGIPTILVFGGSQGAAIFNAAVPAALKRLESRRRFQVLHLAGPGKFETTKKAYGDVPFPLLLLESSGRMELFLGAADLVVCRSGGSTVAELARFGKAAVLIPYPYAAEHHQDDNARVLEAAGGAELLPNAECSPERLEQLFDRLLASPETLAERGARAAECAVPDAAGRLLVELTNRLRKRP
ncbi:UDP-N-acetylglucosamine--N-acetylmuramyl-(pentapeptide) pyrophosphoryl-undecaprenol N-acetylglucosamine transferase [uncultured Victivallis sp.]|uniref:UDP-N-acetylglucosamine--N-acetylmuramyl- (pentapeptide) pyrophosphoryl-undecaprenol N-acetylglucosamine transferase n=1 Tax=uncultured Victivallis sp. TaxID=354118 RepID=UPI0025D46BCC|nr:UDP-N-acetylglucosamine--N-acetylmuramyl-(pentapeptide) pyrophosphoryl-undecaprenol N-acetylglucosamine transferase [uncultured Victivallis sp.]